MQGETDCKCDHEHASSATDQGSVEAAPTSPPLSSVTADSGKGDNPLVTEEAHKGTKTKKKKAAVPVQDKGSTLDMITAKLKELEKKTEGPPPTETYVDPTQEVMEMYNESGENVVRENYQKQIQENKKLERELTLVKRKTDQLTKEKDKMKVQIADNKADMQRVQLRCTELQKQIKTVKDTAAKMESEKESQRAQLEQKFEVAISEISGKLESGSDRNDLLKENEELQAKTESLEKEFEEKIEVFTQSIEEKQKILDEKKAALALVETEAVQQRSLSSALEEKVAIVEDNCKHLEMQINSFRSRMGEYQDTVTRSHDVFESFGKELERLKKHIETQEEDRAGYKQEIKDLEKNTVVAVEERQRLRKKVDALNVANQKLQTSAKQLNGQRSDWKPFMALIAEWKKTKEPAETDEGKEVKGDKSESAAEEGAEGTVQNTEEVKESEPSA